MDLKLNLDYIVREHDDALFRKASRNITDFLIRQAIAAKYPNGVKVRSEQRIVARLQNALATAMVEEKDVLPQVAADHIQFLYDVLKEWSAPAVLTNWFVTLFDAVEALIRDIEAAAKTPKSGSTS